MAAKRMIDFLREAEAFHEELHRLYESLEHEAFREDVKALLTYMSVHQEAIARCLRDYERGAGRKVLDAWFKVAPDVTHPTEWRRLELRPDTTPSEVVAYAMKMDASLMAMYETLLREAVSQDLRDALQNILDIEQREEVKLLRTSSA